MSMAGIQMTHIPYKGIAPAITAQLANEVQNVLHAHRGGHAARESGQAAAPGFQAASSGPWRCPMSRR